jgi:DNA-binding response OmpR family regulator
MRILLAEDDPRLAQPLVEYLERDHHTLTWLSSGQRALEALLESEYELALLDWMLPDHDGLSIVRRLRGEGITTLVIMITARVGLGDVVEGLREGADDYLVKPFRMAELAARIRALERRGGRPYQPYRLRWGGLELDPTAGLAWCDGQPLTLTRKEWQLLEWFLRHPARLVSRCQLLDQLWSLEVDSGEETVKTHLNNLRRKLRAKGSPDPIETVHGQGYRLATPALE